MSSLIELKSNDGKQHLLVGSGNQPKLYIVGMNDEGKTIGGFFFAARHTASDAFTCGIQVAAFESSSAGWLTASAADNLFSAIKAFR